MLDQFVKGLAYISFIDPPPTRIMIAKQLDASHHITSAKIIHLTGNDFLANKSRGSFIIFYGENNHRQGKCVPEPDML